MLVTYKIKQRGCSTLFNVFRLNKINVERSKKILFVATNCLFVINALERRIRLC